MIRIAIVEDENKSAETLNDFIQSYGSANGISFTVSRFNNAVDFLTGYKPVYDLVFMDILMPNLSGMDAARKLRQIDAKTLLIFVTNLAQYAVKGYEVDALDFIVKPVMYQDFCLKMKKAIKLVQINEDREFVITQSGGMRRISTKNIFFVEVAGHKLIYHTSDGEITGYGSLSETEEKLRADDFLRCNSCYLVNPKHIVSVKKYDVVMSNGAVLQISQPKKKKFMSDFAEWLGKGNYSC
ncbi:MAG: response regulator transcription factor [Clostridiales bacterium]|nr:response regulator transcription factor [Clostridiales bacterium]